MYNRREAIIIGTIITLLLLVALASCRTNKAVYRSEYRTDSIERVRQIQMDSILLMWRQQQTTQSYIAYRDMTTIVDSLYVREYTDSVGLVHTDKEHKIIISKQKSDTCLDMAETSTSNDELFVRHKARDSLWRSSGVMQETERERQNTSSSLWMWIVGTIIYIAFILFIFKYK